MIVLRVTLASFLLACLTTTGAKAEIPPLDGPGLEQVAAWLLPTEALAAVPAEDPERRAALTALLADPDPTTPANELLEAAARRLALGLAEGLTPLDDRAKLLFLQGPPRSRKVIDCAETFQPLELWTYTGQTAVLSTPRSRHVMRLWIPLDGKAGLYSREMEFWLREWHSYGDRVRGKRIDRFLCEDSEEIDLATGTDGLLGAERTNAPGARSLLGLLAPPTDHGAWARTVLAQPLPNLPALLAASASVPLYPATEGARIRTRLIVTIPPEATVTTVEDEVTKRKTVRFTVGGTIEHEGAVLETVRSRYELPVGDGPRPPVALVLERSLRPGLAYVARLDVVDEAGGARRRLVVPLAVPREPTPVVEPDLPESSLVALADDLAQTRIAGADSIVLLPPESDVVFGRWRAEAIVTGERIEKVAFSLDGKVQLTRREGPYTVELDLPTIPQPLAVRAEGFAADGTSVALDEIVLNQPRGELEVSILEPARGVVPTGRFTASVEVVVPEGRQVERVVLALNDGQSVTLERPPWRIELDPPPAGEIAWLTATATLDDNTSAEDTRFLAIPGTLDEVDVRLVELYTTVTDRTGALVRGLSEDEFAVREDKRPQKIAKFELVEDLPLTIGITLDASGSMYSALGEAQRAASQFLERVVTPRDLTFAVGFATKPALLMPRTADAGAVTAALTNLAADGWTALHDAIVFSLYYFRGTHGRRALVLLSDGDDTSSRTPFRDALEYARRSGVVVYTIGLKNDALNLGARGKLADLAQATGGKSFLIDKAEELDQVYAQIEAELRSQYLLAYAPDRPPSAGFREVEVDVTRRGLTARTIPGYHP